MADGRNVVNRWIAVSRQRFDRSYNNSNNNNLICIAPECQRLQKFRDFTKLGMATHFDLLVDNISNFYKSKMADGRYFEKPLNRNNSATV